MADDLFGQNDSDDKMSDEAQPANEPNNGPEASEKPKKERKPRSTQPRTRKRIKVADEGPVASSDAPDEFPEGSEELSTPVEEAAAEESPAEPTPTAEYGTIDLTKSDSRRKKPARQARAPRGGSEPNSNGQTRPDGGRGRSARGGDDRSGARGERRENRKKDRKRNDSGSHPGEPIEGMLELIGDKKFGFMREVSTSLTKGDNDPFMPPPLIQKYNLRDGVTLKGIIKPGRKGAWQVTEVHEVMGVSPEEWSEFQDFDAGTTIYPNEKLNLVTGSGDYSMRIIDLVAPLGKGQRALIVAPPRAGKTVMLKQIADGIAENHKEVKLVALLVDERPEEVTDFTRNTAASVFASSNDFGEDNHVRVATLAFEYARRLVEMGHDVVILLDSLTRLGRTFNLWGGNSGRTMSGGLDSRALLMPRKIFGSARNIEGGGSLTIIATSLIETGSRMDDVIFEEFKGTGNSEIVLDRELADKRIYPAINVRKSGTRNEERLMSEDVLRQRHMLFRVLAERHPVEAMQALLKQVQRSPTNEHLLNELIPEQTL